MNLGQKFFIEKHIAFIGFMGSGKTSVSNILSEQTGISCLDTDNLIVDFTKKTISEILNTSGIDAFRRIEACVLDRIIDEKKCIISTGGGIVDSAIGRGSLKKCYCVWLQVNAFNSRKRIKDLSSRPLFKNVENAAELIEKRDKIYDQYCDFKIDTNDKDLHQVVFEVKNHLINTEILHY